MMMTAYPRVRVGAFPLRTANRLLGKPFQLLPTAVPQPVAGSLNQSNGRLSRIPIQWRL